MASTPISAKRPFQPANDAGAGSSGDAKRLRSNDGSPVPAPNSTKEKKDAQTELERNKADVLTRMAAIKAKVAASKTNAAAPSSVLAQRPPPPPAPASDDLEAKKAEAARRIAEVKAKIAAKRAQAGLAPTAVAATSPTAATPPPQPLSDVQQRIAEARVRAAEIAKQRVSASGNAISTPPVPALRQDSGRSARGGLGIGLHPSLMGDSSGGVSSSMTSRGKSGVPGPKFSTTKGNQQVILPTVNPYLPSADDNDAAPLRDPEANYDNTIIARKGGERKSKSLIFNRKGKFMAQANALRQQARLEDMKRRIAADARKTAIEQASDKAFLVPAPPDVEWWDENLVESAAPASYTPLPFDQADDNSTILTNLVQHPVILQAPQDKLQPPPKPLMLTPSEQKKLRRQRRMADMKETQAKIRLGLIEPPAPKVKKSNMMRVLGEQAVKDPTAVEARVNREIAARKAEHEQANAARQLTPAQRAQKLQEQQTKDEQKGVRVAVFRVKDLSSGKHRYQVDVNAKQGALTGIVVLHPDMNLIIVEGGAHGVAAYKKLMLQRIRWLENTLPLSGASGPSTFTGGNDGTKRHASTNPNHASSSNNNDAGASASAENKAAQWLNPLNERGELKDLSGNKCVLVWEGEEPARAFKRWGSKACETDGEARDVLLRMGKGMEGMWTLARSV